MIRSRLKTTLLMVLVVVLGLGAGAMWMVHSHANRFEHLLEEELRAIMTTHSITHNASVISSHLASEPLPGRSTSNPILRQASSAMKQDVASLTVKTPEEQRARDELAALVDSLEEHLAGGNGDGEQIAEFVQGASRVSQRIATFNSTRLLAERARFGSQTRDATVYVGLLIVVALLILGVLYWQFNTLALKPLGLLTRSVREVQKQNFELSLPVERDDEIGRLSEAYNDMAAELQKFHHETDAHIVDLNTCNRILLNAFPHAVIVLNGEGGLVQVNPEAETLLDALATPDRLPAKLRGIFDRVLKTGEEFFPEALDEALLFRISDREVYYLPRVFRLPADSEVEGSWGVILVDVTRFRWLDDMKVDALATVSHEIKTPLTSIRMILHLLLEQKTGSLTDLQEEMITSASNDCERLLGTLETLLEHTRLASGSKHLDLMTMTPRDLLAELPLSLVDAAREKGVTLEVLVDENLPRVSADPPRITQVINNLLSNAIKFAPGGTTVTVTASKRGADHVRFSFSDHGPGVPDDLQDRIFERFFREPGQAHEGTGLGLSICREIIEAHDGRISFTSEPDQPTRFFFDLAIA